MAFKLKCLGGESEARDFHVENHIRGALYGNAAGDTIGLLTEFFIKEEVKKYYGKYKDFEYDQKVPDLHRNRWAIGDWTDDTDQMITIIDSLLANNGEVVPVDFAKRIKSWSENGFAELGDNVGMGIGATTHKVLTHPNFLKDPHQVSQFVWEANDKKIAPNGAVMRTSVLGIFRYNEIDQVIQNTLDICKVTHADPRCQASCVAVTTAIAMMLQRQPQHVKKDGTYNVTTIMEDSYNHAKVLVDDEDMLAELREHMFASSLSKLKLTEHRKIGYTLKCLGAGFWAFRQNNFRDALQKIVKEAGDADTNGAVAGALLGCKLGFDKIPESWITNLKHKDWFEQRIVRFIQLMGSTVSREESKSSPAFPGQPEASPGKPEASPGQPEASPGQPEASAGQPEASPGQPEASPGQPEASPGKPEASPGKPEASPGQPEASAGQS